MEPQTLKAWTKRHPILTGIGSIGIFLILICLIGAVAGDKKPAETAAPVDSTVAETSSRATAKTAPSETPKAQPKKAEPTVAPSASKSYQQVFSFSGNGAKKSEPFSISGSRFKIQYNCAGDYCGAFLYKVGSKIPELIVNSADPIKDESTFYGSGEYYIDANTTGAFSMTVLDYK